MGMIYELNWILKLPKEQIPELKTGYNYTFYKKGTRMYPISIPIDLVNDNWEGIAKCVITSISIDSNKTSGTYEIIKVYNKSEKTLITALLRDMLYYVTGDNNITNFSNTHIT